MIQESYRRTFDRPNLQVDRRITRTAETTAADLRRRLFGRTSLTVSGERGVDRVPEGEAFLGSDLHRTLSSDRYGGRGELSYALTPKTALTLQGGRLSTRFPFAPERDGDTDQVSAGIQTSSTALISGRVMAGYGWFRLKAGVGSRRFETADVDATWHVSARTRIGGSYLRTLQYSAFQVGGPTPTLLMQTWGAHIEKELLGTRLLLTLQGSVSRLESDGPVVLVQADGNRETRTRDDTFRNANATLTYLFKSRLRVGGTAAYVERRSTFSDLGINGLLMGATVSYNP
jgi:hypothetical protein